MARFFAIECALDPAVASALYRFEGAAGQRFVLLPESGFAFP
jgi:hypothetical protein